MFSSTPGSCLIKVFLKSVYKNNKGFLKNSAKFLKIYRKIPVPESLLFTATFPKELKSTLE